MDHNISEETAKTANDQPGMKGIDTDKELGRLATHLMPHILNLWVFHGLCGWTDAGIIDWHTRQLGENCTSLEGGNLPQLQYSVSEWYAFNMMMGSHWTLQSTVFIWVLNYFEVRCHLLWFGVTHIFHVWWTDGYLFVTAVCTMLQVQLWSNRSWFRDLCFQCLVRGSPHVRKRVGSICTVHDVRLSFRMHRLKSQSWFQLLFCNMAYIEV